MRPFSVAELTFTTQTRQTYVAKLFSFYSLTCGLCRLKIRRPLSCRLLPLSYLMVHIFWQNFFADRNKASNKCLFLPFLSLFSELLESSSFLNRKRSAMSRRLTPTSSLSSLSSSSWSSSLLMTLLAFLWSKRSIKSWSRSARTLFLVPGILLVFSTSSFSLPKSSWTTTILSPGLPSSKFSWTISVFPMSECNTSAIMATNTSCKRLLSAPLFFLLLLMMEGAASLPPCCESSRVKFENRRIRHRNENAFATF